MNSNVQQKLSSVLNNAIEPLHDPGDYKSLLDKIQDARIVMLGESTHGMHASIQAVIRYLTKVDPQAAKEAKKRYGCFDHTIVDPQLYGFLASQNAKSCVDEVVQSLNELQQNSFRYTSIDGKSAADDYFLSLAWDDI